MPTDPIALERYVTHGRTTVQGWFGETDARLFPALSALAPGPGDVVEVGVFMGASAIELGYLRRAGERLVLIDPFVDIPEDRYAPDADLSVDRFLANWRRFHPGHEPEVLVATSQEALPTLPDGNARFVHVDGWHSYDVVEHDLTQALRIARPDAVLVFDDAGQWNWPGVAAAVWGAVLRGALVPLAVTEGKLYATPPGSPLTTDAVVAAARGAGLQVPVVHEVDGHGVAEVRTAGSAGGNGLRRTAGRVLPPAVVDGMRALRRRLG